MCVRVCTYVIRLLPNLISHGCRQEVHMSCSRHAGQVPRDILRPMNLTTFYFNFYKRSDIMSEHNHPLSSRLEYDLDKKDRCLNSTALRFLNFYCGFIADFNGHILVLPHTDFECGGIRESAASTHGPRNIRHCLW